MILYKNHNAVFAVDKTLKGYICWKAFVGGINMTMHLENENVLCFTETGTNHRRFYANKHIRY